MITWHRSLVLASMALALTIPLRGQSPAAQSAGLSEARVLEAIKTGLAKRSLVFLVRPFFTDFTLEIAGPEARIARAARDATVGFKPFAISDVTEEMAGPDVSVTAIPDAPKYSGGTGWNITPPATSVVILPRGSKDITLAVHARKNQTFTTEWGNAAGGKWHGQGVVAWFDLNAFPPGDIDVVVILDNQGPYTEQRFGIRARDRVKIR